MRFVPKAIVSASDSSPRMVYALLDFMRTASPAGPGWTVPASSNGSTVDTGGAGANITSYADLNQWSSGPLNVSWFVLESPDGLKQLMFSRYGTSNQDWYVLYSPGANFGDLTVGTIHVWPDSNDRGNLSAGRIESGGGVLHIGADDEAPYGWWLYEHASGNFATSRGCLAWIPVVSTQAGDTDPYAFFGANINTGGAYTAVYLDDENNSWATTCVIGMLNGVFTNCPAITYESNNGLFIPNGCRVDEGGSDLSFPVPFGLSTRFANAAFKGISTFMQWNGANRAAGETFASKTRVSWGDVNFPWNGTTPEIS